ncbi:hypothetical protein DUNSADRAFT_11793 [Dunaliella salina]|uniref:Secreted protein n=1 Tax=Dunaliella salina TaxID=3046 RepID=A0ABQ7FRV5_DUNSA|nr:hypothetical protein DUNSADRAFT_11793 [Dunaliella salina]|eukprot:KAF5825314.1 hypothetical protein DUNSADRAFT_11793 [Dunaliella salina]
MKAAAALVATCGGRSLGGSSNGDSGADGGPDEDDVCWLGGDLGPAGTARRQRTGRGGSSRGSSQQDVGCIATATLR